MLALSLLKNGIPVRIVEKDPVYYTGIFRGSGISVCIHRIPVYFVIDLSSAPQPRTQEVEHFLGVLDEVKELAKGPPILHIYDQHDPKRIVKSIDFIQDYEPSPPFLIASTGRFASGCI